MTEVLKVLVTQFLRSEPKFLPLTFIDPGDGGLELQVIAGEKVGAGAKPDVDEVAGERSFKWVFVEAMGGQQIEKRKGFVSNEFLGPENTVVPVSPGFEPFPTQLSNVDFANTCYLQANLNETNSAYLYALAFALSGKQWIAPDMVGTDDADDAPTFGVYRFPKATWARLITEPEATGILPEDIKFPDIQCDVAAIVAAKAANLLKSVITDRGLSAVDLFLAHLFADSNGFGSDAAAAILKAEKDDKTQLSDAVVKAIYPDDAVRTAFFKRNENIFQADGSATIEKALAACTTLLDAGFAKVRELADEIEGDVFGDIPSQPTGPILSGVGGDPQSATDGGTVTGVGSGIDRRQFLDELRKNPALIEKAADMVKGEVGWLAPHDTKLVQLETAFNRAMARGQTIARVLLSKSDDRQLGYYQGGRNGTYSRPVTTAEFEDFKKTILPELLAGSNKSQQLLNIIATGNASGSVAADQVAHGTPHGQLPTAIHGQPETYFLEGPLRFLFKFLAGGETISLPGGPSSSGSAAVGGEPPEHMDGDTEGSGPIGGKFNQKAGTPIAPLADHATVTLSNGINLTVNKLVAAQFAGFFNDIIKLGAPVRELGGFGTRPNPSQHPRGFAVDWQQHSRNVVDADVGKWIKDHRGALKKLELRWGLSGGENWNHPDTGHFSVERILGARHLAASAKASASS